MLTITCDRYSNNVEVVSDKHGDITESMEIVKMKIDLSTCEPAMVTFTCLVDKTNIIIDDNNDNVNILKKDLNLKITKLTISILIILLTVCSVYVSFNNPDMTRTMLFMAYWKYILSTYVVGGLFVYLAYCLDIKKGRKG